MRWIAVATLLALPARAQDSTTVRPCDVGPATDTVAALIYGRLYVVPLADSDRVARGYLGDVLELIRESWHSTPMALTTYDLAPYHATLAAEATMSFDLTRDGKVEKLGLAASSLSRAFDRQVYDAVRRADSVGMIPQLPPHAGRRVSVILDVWTRRDTNSVQEGRGAARPLLRTRLPVWGGPIVMPWPEPRSPSPSYPEVARRANVEDSLFVRFMIDERGRAVLPSVFFERGTYREFARSVLDGLPRARYRAGSVHGCPVTSLVSEWFSYRLNR
jgi:TonB family protein